MMMISLKHQNDPFFLFVSTGQSGCTVGQDYPARGERLARL